MDRTFVHRKTSRRKVLTPAQAQARFGATSAQIQAVESWLTGAGLTVTGGTGGAGGYVSVAGTVAEAGQAFGVSFADYTDPTGRTARAPVAAATVPSSVSADVLTVSGLDTGNHEMRPGDTLPPPGPNYWVAPPTSSYYASKIATNEPTANGRHWPWTVGGYTPQQIRGAYNVSDSGTTGRGQTVAIVDAYASPTMLSDADEFSQVTGNRPFRSGQYRQYLPSTFTLTSNDECGAQGWYGEETLDVESVHDMPEGGTNTPMRVVPDVSALADPSTGMLVGQTTLQPNGKTYAFSLSRIGGTSVASPTFAGIEADAQQAAGHDLGFANPAIYARFRSSAFHDVTESPLGQYEVRNNYADADTATGPLVTFLRAMGVDGEDLPGDNAALPATPGYDDSTGVGSPNRYIQSFSGR